MDRVAELIREVEEETRRLQNHYNHHFYQSAGIRKELSGMGKTQEERFKTVQADLRTLQDVTEQLRIFFVDATDEGGFSKAELVRLRRNLQEWYQATDSAIAKICGNTHLQLNEKKFLTNEEYIMPVADFTKHRPGRARPEFNPIPKDIQEGYERRQK